MSVKLSEVISLLEDRGPSSLDTLAHVLDESETTLRALLTGAYRRGTLGFDNGLYSVLSASEQEAVRLTMSPPAAPASKPTPAAKPTAPAKPKVTSAQLRELLAQRGKMTAAELASAAGISSGHIGPLLAHDRRAGRVRLITLDRVNYYKLEEKRDSVPPAAPAAPAVTDDSPPAPPVVTAAGGSGTNDVTLASAPAMANMETITVPTVEFMTSEIHRLIGELRHAKELRAALINLNRLTKGELVEVAH
ncbi:hypothetical protein ROV06_004950 [Serratia marcescens]|nr:hypothetical protein [Serratia marcescens]